MVILVHTWLVEADTTISGHFLWAEMEIILFIHFYPPKYAHGRSLRHILDKITKWHFFTCGWNLKFFGPIDFIWGAIKVPFFDFIQKMSQAPSKCLSKWIKVDKWDYHRESYSRLSQKSLIQIKKIFLFSPLPIQKNINSCLTSCTLIQKGLNWIQ